MSAKITKHKKSSLKLIKQAAGTANKLGELIEADEYCPLVIQQLDSAIGLLKSARKHLITGHLNSCLVKKLKQDKEKTISELIKIYNLNI
jgi:DNA-binding FrmR family transcriptional regulator